MRFTTSPWALCRIVLGGAALRLGDQVDAPEISGSSGSNPLAYHISAVQVVAGDSGTNSLRCANAFGVVGISAVLAVHRLGSELVETVIAVACNGSNFGDPMEADASMGERSDPGAYELRYLYLSETRAEQSDALGSPLALGQKVPICIVGVESSAS